MKPYSLQWNITEEWSGRPIKEFLANRQLSKRALTDIKYGGGLITVNGKEENVRYRLQTGEELTVVFPPEPINRHLPAEDIKLDVVYEDTDILIISKPAGMATIPSMDVPSGSLAGGIAGYYRKKGIASAVHIVTRLDRNTSGLVLVAKHRFAHHLLSEMQKRHAVRRMYEAVAEGTFAEQGGTIDRPIGRKPGSIIEREVRSDGQAAVTHYKVVRQLSHYAHLSLILETGRTHQIRVHLSSMGHPIAGDDLYGGGTECIGRQALHCGWLSFIHPFQNKEMQFSAPLPKDIVRLLQ